MTRVRISRAGGRWILSAAGHAGYNPGGPDIVCAAVSALCCALGKALDGEKCVEQIRQGPGLYHLTARLQTQAAQGMARMAEAGFDLLAETYPGCVAVEGTVHGAKASEPGGKGAVDKRGTASV